MQFAQKNFYKKFLGRAGEVKAAEFLRKKGYKILDKNYKTHIGEIDLIAKDGDTLVFIEVKTRMDDAFGAPSEAVTLKKQEKYVLVATEYLVRNHLNDTPCRFDVIEIYGEILPSGFRVSAFNHIKNAFDV